MHECKLVCRGIRQQSGCRSTRSTQGSTVRLHRARGYSLQHTCSNNKHDGLHTACKAEGDDPPRSWNIVQAHTRPRSPLPPATRSP
eukprot:1143268-Pelagomonas_calceolata.AAC.6